MGGVLKAIETGFIQNEIHQSAYAHQLAVQSGEAGVVGVNRHVMPERAQAPEFRVDSELGRRQAGRLEALRRRRDAARVEAALGALGQAARGDGSLIEPLRECVRARATIGEMCGRLREVFGAYHEPGVR
jgi:methylmalonyl-CoA mutase N-terminal domain/subunit